MPERKIAIYGLVLILTLLAGCRRDSAPMPPKYGDVMKDKSDRSYLPVRIPDRKAEAVLGQVAATDAVAASEKKEKGGESNKIDDSSAEAAAKSFLAMVLAANLQELPKIMVADQAEAIGKMAEGMTPLAEAAKQLKAALDEKFPDNDIAGFAPAIAPGLGDMVESQTTIEVKAGSSDDEAEATITTGPEGNKRPPIKLTVKKVEQAWRVMLPDFTAPADLDAAAKGEPEKVEAYKDLAKRVKAGEFKDVEAAKTEVANAAAGKYKPAASGEKPTEEKEKATPPAPKPPKTRLGGPKPKTDGSEPTPAPGPRKTRSG